MLYISYMVGHLHKQLKYKYTEMSVQIPCFYIQSSDQPTVTPATSILHLGHLVTIAYWVFA